MYVGLGNARFIASGGQPDALLATDGGDKYRFFPTKASLV